jgi:TolA-binding protein
MTGKLSSEFEPLDLVVRARRAVLSKRERDAFAQALATSATARTAYEIGSDLDMTARVRPGDEALVERALVGTLARKQPIERSRRPRIAVALAATLALASAAAATRQVLVWRSSARPMAPGRAALVEHPASNRTPPRGGPSPAPGAAAAITDPDAHAPAAAPATPLPIPATASRPAPAELDREETDDPSDRATAAGLFREAGAARRAGDLARARALYVELEANFPGSSEARVSRVSLGKLYLSAGKPSDAEAVFAQYLHSGAADLREEALVGRADALRALGRYAEERNVWQELVRRYPASVYANRARGRIAEIEGTDDAPPR